MDPGANRTVGLPPALRLSLLANHFPVLHGLRVAAIGLVIQFHVSTEFILRGLVPLEHDAMRVSIASWFGMDLFFVMSGFLIGNLLLLSQSVPGRYSLRRFYLRRSFRIIPLYYVVLTILSVAQWKLGMLTPAKSANLWREYLYLTNYSDPQALVMLWGWSLAVEEHFYLAVPFVMLALGRVRRLRTQLLVLGVPWSLALVIRLAIVASRSAWTVPQFFEHVYIPTHARYDLLLAGIALALVHRGAGDAWKRRLQRPAARRGLWALAVLPFGAIALVRPDPSWEFYWNAVAMGTLTSIGYVALLLVVLHTRGWHDVLGHRVFLVAATLGYGVYLVHEPILIGFLMPGIEAWVRAGGAWQGAWWVGFVATWVGALAAAYVLHLVVEKPALWLRDRWAA